MFYYAHHNFSGIAPLTHPPALTTAAVRQFQKLPTPWIYHSLPSEMVVSGNPGERLGGGPNFYFGVRIMHHAAVLQILCPNNLITMRLVG